KQRFALTKARLTASGQTVGTPSFMSPEQLMGQEVDARSDLFSVGILLHQLLGGASPFADNGPYSVMVAILENEPPVLPQLSPALRSVLRRALHKSPDERFASAHAMAAALHAAVLPSLSALSTDAMATRAPWLAIVRRVLARLAHAGRPLRSVLYLARAGS